MKKLILLSLFAISFCFVNAQEDSTLLNKVITTDGQILSGNIKSYLNKEIIICLNENKLDEFSIPVDKVSSITGPLSDGYKRRILIHNSKIIFDEYPKVYIDPIYAEPNKIKETTLQVDPKIFKPIQKTPGDLISKSAELRLTSLAITTVSTAIILSDIIEDVDSKITFSVLSVLLSLSFYIAGELTLIKAGKLMNEERVTLSPASEGIGLAINF